MPLDPMPESSAVLEVVLEDAPTCVCGHVRDAHEHYRPGTDCALCDCPRFRKKR
ncbi:hypothetical protein JOE58_001239 [Curtobacterium luteum]|uniref:Uncharacterized protein n=1 Tax=Curtobacterium luteum TaxID=33881 RepID=A0A8H9G7Q7_9MICO|nr:MULTISPECIES: hypothetical protein [Curtobacterium]MBM7801988.1 hypothetical protein [Curtobacterium luteum]NUU51701.1 hypothetical protein [Curtobacterium luteum]GGK86271.1 hypothetical protein GCM10009769_00140 [Curtobacterium luteum]